MMIIQIVLCSMYMLLVNAINTRYIQQHSKNALQNSRHVLHNSRNAHPSHSCNQIKINRDIYVKEWLASKKSDMSKPVPYYVPESKKCR
jgi:hypothetical protein